MPELEGGQLTHVPSPSRRLRNIRYTFNVLMLLLVSRLLYLHSQITRELWHGAMGFLLRWMAKLGLPLMPLLPFLCVYMHVCCCCTVLCCDVHAVLFFTTFALGLLVFLTSLGLLVFLTFVVTFKKPFLYGKKSS